MSYGYAIQDHEVAISVKDDAFQRMVNKLVPAHPGFSRAQIEQAAWTWLIVMIDRLLDDDRWIAGAAIYYNALHGIEGEE